MTSVNCPTGTDRVIEAAEKMREMPEFVVNLQGDNPICPTWFVEAVINEYYKNDRVETVTPVVNLSWEELDKLREHKKKRHSAVQRPFLIRKGTHSIFQKYYSGNPQGGESSGGNGNFTGLPPGGLVRLSAGCAAQNSQAAGRRL